MNTEEGSLKDDSWIDIEFIKEYRKKLKKYKDITIEEFHEEFYTKNENGIIVKIYQKETK
ncbi:hypothetical protein MBCUT_10190 [Methanobrevibacter cuticularis]|uniref:Uncharacterized protein n=1 Tax=Methanobrevibacter cuticularis TaxID=47311 RepID=A0A166E0U2_9EURY|nr:hypothetical protein [Methanobrevibacter cuticularis]KZX16153.1 hypothetical protein MBCUT_10190 [Methanobrevibacter cuticularis]